MQDTDLWFDVIHPRTLHRGEVHHTARMIGAPSGDIFAMLGADLITYERNRPGGCRKRPVHGFQTGDAFRLPCAVIPLPIDLT